MKTEEFNKLSFSEKCIFFESRTIKPRNSVVRGVAENDLDHVVSVVIEGKVIRYPPYVIWKDMITRCYSPDVHTRLPKYKMCSVDERWLTAKNFSKWCKQNYIEGYQLDKDILILNNKIYSEDTCIFVPDWVNSFVLPRIKTNLPSGVTYHKRDKIYNVNYSLEGNTIYVGSFKDVATASKVWKEKKISILNSRKGILDSIDVRLYGCLKVLVNCN